MSSYVNPREHSKSTPTKQPVFGMKRAAEVAGVSVSTIRRNKERLRECGAVISPDGWEVPMSALVASGLMRRQTPPDTPIEEQQDLQGAASSLEQIRQLEREVLELKHRAELAEERQRSAEQQAQNARELASTTMETLRIERLMLSSSVSSSNLLVPQEGNGEPQDNERRFEEPSTSWWRKLFNHKV